MMRVFSRIHVGQNSVILLYDRSQDVVWKISESSAVYLLWLLQTKCAIFVAQQSFHEHKSVFLHVCACWKNNNSFMLLVVSACAC
jgi:hypothetical protein